MPWRSTCSGSCATIVAEGIEWLGRLLALPAAAPRTAMRAQALCDGGALAVMAGHLTLARALLEESLAICAFLADNKGRPLRSITSGA